jgi:hypothetical protein
MYYSLLLIYKIDINMYITCYGVMMTQVTVFVFLYHQPVDDRTTGRNMLVNILLIKIHNKIKVHLLVVYTLYKYDFTFTKVHISYCTRPASVRA